MRGNHKRWHADRQISDPPANTAIGYPIRNPMGYPIR
jgi:hypothetical protein